MELLVKRKPSSAQATLGELYLDGTLFCHTLEDVVREVPGKPVDEWKVFGKTAIPAGCYHVALTMSNRFQRVLPLLENVPGFTGIRIHSGNVAAHTEGCLLVGVLPLDGKPDTVVSSKLTLERLMDKLRAADDIWITVQNPTA